MRDKKKKKEEKETSSPKFDIHKDKELQILKLTLEDLKEKYKLSSEDLIKLIEKKEVSKELVIPISIFDNNLSALETVVKYLKEELNFSNHKIALLLNRDDRTVWTTYNNSLKKRKERLVVKESEFFIPVSIFKNRRLSVLEAITCYLKDEHNLNYHDIALLLNRDERNIWTTYNRARKKCMEK